MGPVKVKLDGPYIHRCPTQTDKYNFILVDFETDEYNLNIFVGTDEYKKLKNECHLHVVKFVKMLIPQHHVNYCHF
jgi:hypothetical protein